MIGVARSMVDPMASNYVGRLLPQEKRAGIISLFFAGMAAVVIIGSPFIGYVSGLWGWRILFILFALPFSTAALMLVWFAIPGSSQESNPNSGDSIVGGFWRITTNRSAVACIACSFLSEATWNITCVYGISFIRQSFAISVGDASYLLIGTSLCFMAGSLSGGRLVSRLGRKRLAILSTLAMSILTLIYLNMGVFFASAGAMLLACVASAMRYTVSESLILEQVPDMRGTVMSLNSIALGLGSATGAALGGYILLSLGYSSLGAFGLLGFAASLLYSSYAVDPTASSSG
jgi:predicted MFS family arabinose efflux permease